MAAGLVVEHGIVGQQHRRRAEQHFALPHAAPHHEAVLVRVGTFFIAIGMVDRRIATVHVALLELCFQGQRLTVGRPLHVHALVVSEIPHRYIVVV